MTRWPAEDIWQAVWPLLPDFTVEVLPEIDSSNSELMRRARAGRLEPVLLVAERQTAGRGRLGRHWHSAAGDSLTFSLGMALAPGDWSGLSLAVGIGLNIAPRAAEGLSTPPAALRDLEPAAAAGGALRKIAEPLVRTLQA
ncbi:MAG: birA, partial [Ramlibacter sp.]|nr:birA [Ramlibacter sp.]